MTTVLRDIGDVERIGNHAASGAAAFKDLTATNVDPTAVTLTVEAPDDVVTVYTYGGSPALQKETTGRFYADILLNQAGRWVYRLAGTGAVTAAAEGSLLVRRTLIR